MHVILSFKLEDHEGLALLRPWPASEEDPAHCSACTLIQIPIRAFLSPVPIYCRVQSRTSWCCLAAAGGMPGPTAHSSGKLSVDFVYFILFLSLLTLLVLLVMFLVFNL